MRGNNLIPNDWDRRFLEAAKCVSCWSPDPSTKIGAIAISTENLPLAWGWNAFPRKVISMVEDTVEREVKYKYVIHAEANVIYNSTRGGILLKNSTFYVYGLPPCLECAKAIIQVGTSRVVTLMETVLPERWTDSVYQATKLFEEVGIKSQIFSMLYERKNSS